MTSKSLSQEKSDDFSGSEIPNKQGIPDQEEVWDKIARNWKENRTLPIKEAEEFLRNKKGKVLDLGCGSGRNITKDSNKEFYGVDFSNEMIEAATEDIKANKAKAKLFKANAWELPFKDNYFDSAIFIATLHCIPSEENREKSLQELKRVLKPGSRALVTVWDKNQERFNNPNTKSSAPPKFIGEKEAYLPWGAGDFPDRQEFLRYYYLYDKEEIAKLLEKYFKVIEVKGKIMDQSRFSKRNLIIEVEK